MLLLIPLISEKELAGSRRILWTISLCQFSHMISPTGFLPVKWEFSLELSFYSIPTGTTNIILFEWRRLKSDVRFISRFQTNFLICFASFFISTVIVFSLSSQTFLKMPSPGFGNTRENFFFFFFLLMEEIFHSLTLLLFVKSTVIWELIAIYWKEVFTQI